MTNVQNLLDDLISQAERTTNEFMVEADNAKRFSSALARLRFLNAQVYAEAVALLQPAQQFQSIPPIEERFSFGAMPGHQAMLDAVDSSFRRTA